MEYNECPNCKTKSTTLDLFALGNLWRVPAAIVLSMFLGPYVKIWIKCKSCKYRYLAYGAELELKR
jgi:hypothetical protein